MVWAYSDATQRSDQPAFLWAIVAFLAQLLGLVLYFIIGRNR
ncbi:PLDc N-terminal domain-containing protein [Halorubrum yunnanense]|uniref:PLDc N-terminal domain-containing protein n=1 Tax=Halorubrum yunnanense TaxID=1526162 RepID=A0ABD5YHA8_9EURY|nr:PLDc N-terminal domain-containing protein [Halorubrum yunnanense]